MEMVFRALADRSRRQLLDRLFANDGLTLGQLYPVPISEIGDRWVEKFARKRAAAVVALKNALEESSNEGS
jgi:hypothetical protein